LKSKEIVDIKIFMEHYFEERSELFNQWSTFSCPDSCERISCQEPSLHVSISLVDLVALSPVSGQKPTELLRRNVKIGFDPIHENEPWIGQVSLELKKPCHFLEGKECSIYPDRPIACALFPEYWFLVEDPEHILQKDIFRNFPCIQEPFSISPRRKTALQRLFGVFGKETFLSNFYLFGVSPFVVDLKNIAGEGLEGIPASEGGRATVPHHRFEEIISQRLQKGGHLDEREDRVRKLDQADGLEDFMKMKRWTDQIAAASGEVSLSIVYQFDNNRLHPIRLRK
jgi:Fe-S-cluster containining protein